MVEDLGDGLERFATDFIDRTRQLKSLVLLRSSEPSEHTDKVLPFKVLASPLENTGMRAAFRC